MHMYNYVALRAWDFPVMVMVEAQKPPRAKIHVISNPEKKIKGHPYLVGCY